ncbi:MAG TPA: hypothetical protein VF695_08460 [Sphingomonas sp.]|jgi:hypothetical protein
MAQIPIKAAKHLVLALALTGLNACQSGGSGRLMPKSAPGVSLSRASVDGDIATLERSPLTISVRGFWASNGGQSLYVTYRNTSQKRLSVPMEGWTLAARDAAAPLTDLVDVTGTDIAAAPPPTDGPYRLFTTGDAAARPLVVPPGESRSLSVGFARFGPEGREPVVGTEVEARIPTQGSTVRLRFTCAGGVG